MDTPIWANLTKCLMCSMGGIGNDLPKPTQSHHRWPGGDSNAGSGCEAAAVVLVLKSNYLTSESEVGGSSPSLDQ